MADTDPETTGSFLDPSQAGDDQAETDPQIAARVAEFGERFIEALTGGREVFVVTLAGRHAAYLRQRAANHGETPERHLETILRNFRSYFDDRRPEHQAAPPERGEPATTRRA